MAVLWSILGYTPAALLLLQTISLLPAGTVADGVTWKRCTTVYFAKYERVVITPLDIEATNLDVSRCELTEVNPSDFIGVPNVQALWLQNNDLAQLQPSTFQSLPKLKHLYLSSNKLRELPIFDENSLPHLTILQIADNLLTGIYDAKTFSACLKLRKLKLDENKIEYLHPDVFKPLLELFELNLRKNRITSLPATMFASNTKLTYLELNKNSFAQLPTNFASEVKKTGVRTIDFYSYNNTWQCECLLELMLDCKRVDLTYSNLEYYDFNEFVRHGLHETDATHYNGKLPECHFSGYVPAPQIKYKLPHKIQCIRE